jgi:hypothetical protein
MKIGFRWGKKNDKSLDNDEEKKKGRCKAYHLK